MELMDLFRPKWRRSNWHVRLAAVKMLTDQNILGQVARTDGDGHVRVAAAEKLVDDALAQATYADVSNTPWDEQDIRVAAVKKLVEQTALAAVAESDTFWGLRLAAAEKLTNQAAAQAIYVAAIAAAEKLHTSSIGRFGRPLARGAYAAIAEDYEHIRMTAFAKLTDQAALAEVAKGGWDHDVRLAAVAKLADQATLAEVAGTAWDRDVIEAAVDKLADQATLVEVARRTDCKDDVRLAAARKLIERDNTSGYSILVDLVKAGSKEALTFLQQSLEGRQILKSQFRVLTIIDGCCDHCCGSFDGLKDVFAIVLPGGSLSRLYCSSCYTEYCSSGKALDPKQANAIAIEYLQKADRIKQQYQYQGVQKEGLPK